MYLYIYLANLFYNFILYQYMCITLDVYIDFILCSTIEYYCINMMLYKLISIYIYECIGYCGVLLNMVFSE